jgi:hypothetical protein
VKLIEGISKGQVGNSFPELNSNNLRVKEYIKSMETSFNNQIFLGDETDLSA